MENRIECLLIKDKDVLDNAIYIFGPIVSNAYVCIDNSCYETREDKIKKLKMYQKNSTEEKEISIDGRASIIILFKNNNLVKFTTSEWGSILKFEESFEEII